MTLIGFLKTWTLPVAMGFGTLAYLAFAGIPQLAPAAAFFGPVFDTLLPAFMFLILFVTFCKIDFHKMKPRRWHLAVGVFQTLTVLAVVGVVLGFGLQGEALVLAEGVLVCIISPCAAAAPVVTGKLDGSVEAMTTYTFLSNIITAGLVPLFFPLIEPRAGMTFLPAFGLILYKVCLVLVVPMLLAYIVKHHLHRLHRAITGVRDLAFYTWGVSLSIVTGTTVKNICHASASLTFLLLIGLSSLLLCAFQFAAGKHIGRRYTTVIESGQGLGQKNTAFAIWMASAFLNPLSSVAPGCYILWQNIVNSVEIWHHTRRK